MGEFLRARFFRNLVRNQAMQKENVLLETWRFTLNKSCLKLTFENKTIVNETCCDCNSQKRVHKQFKVAEFVVAKLIGEA